MCAVIFQKDTKLCKMAPHFALFEHAAGYALFKVKEFEEVATFLPQVEEAVLDVSKFNQVNLWFRQVKV